VGDAVKRYLEKNERRAAPDGRILREEAAVTEPETATPAQPAITWSEQHLPTLLRFWKAFGRVPPLPDRAAQFLTALLGILGLLAFVTLIAYAVEITSRP